MKKLISFLICSIFITTISFSSIYAAEGSNQNSSDKIGLNIKTFLGLGKMWLKVDDKRIQKYKSDFTFPNAALSTSYIILKNLELGLTYQYDEFEFTTSIEEQDENGNPTGKSTERSFTEKIHQISIDIVYTFCVPYVQPYVGLGLVPFMKKEGSERKETPKFAFAGIIGAKYAINDLVGLFTQLSYEKSLQAKWDEEEWNSDEEMEEISYKLSISSFQLLFGVGVSL